MEVAFSSSFKKNYRKRIKDDKEIDPLFWTCLELFIEDPNNPRLRTHKLSGKLKTL